ncbi:RBBP9/YdeN family alpha/beta hydrolase [Actinoplanes sp. CA-015351]|uniref:RBBP9/YdeN family alpha/beta hydrolase n=1 Tax=Actinoplanes sp. CA-015351 TaxID=3239897 RepID=UPI003D975636
MSESFLLLHGWQNRRPPEHWQHWLAGELIKLGHSVDYPQLPDPDFPLLEDWLAELRTRVAAMSGNRRTVLCHSLGCLLWLNAAARAEVPLQVDRVLLVAPPSPSITLSNPEIAGFAITAAVPGSSPLPATPGPTPPTAAPGSARPAVAPGSAPPAVTPGSARPAVAPGSALPAVTPGSVLPTVTPAQLAAASRYTRLVGTDNDPYFPDDIRKVFGTPLNLPTDVLPGAAHLNMHSGYGPWPSVLAWSIGPDATPIELRPTS